MAKVKKLVSYRLLDIKIDPESFYRNADGTNDRKRQLGFAGQYFVQNPISILDEKGVLVSKRYIPGAPTLDVIEQDAKKIPYNSTESSICFTDGEDIAFDASLNPRLEEFLDIHVSNENSPNHNPIYMAKQVSRSL